MLFPAVSSSLLLVACSHATTTRPTASNGLVKFTRPSDATMGVYKPLRLYTLKECVWFAGTVMERHVRSDGDLHLLLGPDQGDTQFMNGVNEQAGGMVVEIMPGQNLPAPSGGEHIKVCGTWVFDTNTGWNEIHPVWGIRHLDTGASAYSLPPNPPLYNPDSNS